MGLRASFYQNYNLRLAIRLSLWAAWPLLRWLPWSKPIDRIPCPSASSRYSWWPSSCCLLSPWAPCSPKRPVPGSCASAGRRSPSMCCRTALSARRWPHWTTLHWSLLQGHRSRGLSGVRVRPCPRGAEWRKRYNGADGASLVNNQENAVGVGGGTTGDRGLARQKDGRFSSVDFGSGVVGDHRFESQAQY